MGQARLLHVLGVIETGLGLYREAETPLTDSLNIRQRLLAEDDPEIVRTHVSLAGLMRRTGRHDEARSHYLRALDLRERSLGQDDRDVLQILNDLGSLYHGTGDLEAALEAYERALEIREANLGPRHILVARSYYNMACVAALQGLREQALRLLNEAITRGHADPWILEDPDLESLHGDPEYEAIVSDLRGAAPVDSR